MNTETENNRRDFLKKLFAGAGTALVAAPMTKALAESCGILTPRQTQGPFYPVQPISNTQDLTRVEGRTARAKGEIVVIRGIIQDKNCNPVKNATVEIWQACESGRYNHPSDPNTAPLDPNFKYSGEVVTDAGGTYSFRTIIPGAYPADTNWIRPPHIHFKISALGHPGLVTQMYFEGDSLNSRDEILRSLSPAEQDSVIVKFGPRIGFDDDHARFGTFNIILK